MNRRKNREGETSTKSTKTNSNLHESLPNFAQMKFSLAQTNPREIVTWDSPKLWEIQIKPMNENGEKRRTKITASNRNPRGQKEDLGLHSHSKSQEIYHKNLRFLTSPKKS
jgi:hypothetical protein